MLPSCIKPSSSSLCISEAPCFQPCFPFKTPHNVAHAYSCTLSLQFTGLGGVGFGLSRQASLELMAVLLPLPPRFQDHI